MQTTLHNPKSNQSILNYDFTILQKCFYDMVLNPSKCFYICLGSKSEINDSILEDSTKIRLTLEHEILGITIDTYLEFYGHLKQLCKKVATKLKAFTRIIPYLDKKQMFFIIFYQRKTKLLSRNLDFLFQAFELLEKANENTIHINNINIPMKEICKFLNGLSPPIMSEIFKKSTAHTP